MKLPATEKPAPESRLQQSRPEPRVGVLADPCAENPDSWLGDPDTWRRLDWGQRCRYWPVNSRLTGPRSPARAVFIGDSITEAWGTADPGLFTDDVLNRGISGQTSDQMLVRFRSDVIELEPRAVHLMAGTNDVAGNAGPTSLEFIQGNIQAMVEQALLHRIGVVIASIPPAARIPWRPQIERPDLTIARMNKWLREYARCQHLVFVDYTAVLGDGRGGMKPELSADGVHPNVDGYALMAPLARTALAQAVSAPVPTPRSACEASTAPRQ